MIDLPRRLHDLLRKHGGMARPDDPDGIAENLAAVMSEEEAREMARLLESAEGSEWAVDAATVAPEVTAFLSSVFGEKRMLVAQALRDLIFRRRLCQHVRNLSVTTGKKGSVKQ